MTSPARNQISSEILKRILRELFGDFDFRLILANFFKSKMS